MWVGVHKTLCGDKLLKNLHQIIDEGVQLYGHGHALLKLVGKKSIVFGHEKNAKSIRNCKMRATFFVATLIRMKMVAFQQNEF